MSRVASSLIGIMNFHSLKPSTLAQKCVKQWKNIMLSLVLSKVRHYKGKKKTLAVKKHTRSFRLTSLLLRCTIAYTLWQITETPRIVSLYPSCARYRMKALGAVVIFSAKA